MRRKLSVVMAVLMTMFSLLNMLGHLFHDKDQVKVPDKLKIKVKLK